ncbi:hypothetical protein [Candidatus Cyanaurora vandensis]|uniref:hypothetical protein n=1 Tax=Candidatus Cyanaurora vandensis TaxID=2714958 RepID=UPI00257A9BC9|nr:hypothetical protein [Candidatus Cyanaurora vandensis]
MRGLLVLGLVGLLSSGVRAEQPPQVRQRLEAIVTQMKGLQFCKSGGCLYRNIQYILTPDKTKKTYQAVVKADIERRSQTFDRGSYRFIFQEPTGWQLVGGTESTDVNETVYTQNRYESNSVYSRQANRGLVADLPTGYKFLYLQVLNQGQERR